MTIVSSGLVLLVFVGVATLSACSQPGDTSNATSSRSLEDVSAATLFERIKIGMTRTDVDKLLGPPSLASLAPELKAWYLPPPVLEPHESPFAPGSIGVLFDDDVVVEKTLNSQCKNATYQR